MGYAIEVMQANGQWYAKGDLTGSATLYETESAAYNSRYCWNLRRHLNKYRIVYRNGESK